MKKILLKHKIYLCSFILCTFFAGMVSVSFAYIVQQFISAIQTKSVFYFKCSIILFLCFVVLNFSINKVQAILQANIQKKLHLEIKNRLMNYCLQMDFETQLNTSLGEKINYFEYYISVYEEYFLESSLTIISSAFLLFSSMFYLIKINFIISLSIFVLGILSLFLPVFFGNIINDLIIKNAEYSSIYLTKIKEIITGVGVIKSFNVNRLFLGEFQHCLVDLENSSKRLKVKNAELNQLSASFQYIVIVVCLLLSGWNVLKGNLTLGELIALTQISNMVINPIQQLGNSIIDIIGSKEVRNRIESMINSQQSVQELDNFDEKVERIVLSNVEFALNNGKKILNDINVEFEKDKKYAIIGVNGSGKSSLANVIAGINKNYMGNLIINGKNVKSYSVKDIIMVAQKATLFNKTIRDNILLGRNISDDILKKLLNSMSVSVEFLDRKPVSDEGNDVSGGEAKKINIARALLSDSSVLILDEFDASLDVNSKNVIEELLLQQKKMMIFITHNIEQHFLEKMDSIIVMRDGKIIKCGRYQEIVSYIEGECK